MKTWQPNHTDKILQFTRALHMVDTDAVLDGDGDVTGIAHGQLPVSAWPSGRVLRVGGGGL